MVCPVRVRWSCLFWGPARCESQLESGLVGKAVLSGVDGFRAFGFRRFFGLAGFAGVPVLLLVLVGGLALLLSVAGLVIGSAELHRSARH